MPARAFTPVTVFDLRLKSAGRTEIAFPDGNTTLALVLHGKVAVGGGEAVGEADLAISDRAGGGVAVEAKADADRRAGGQLRPFRDEHPGRDPPGDAGLTGAGGWGG
jgi:redox-sensitive bicupin YhaK (pirin superfamily)